MTSHIEGFGFPGLTTRLTTRLQEYVLKLVAGGEDASTSHLEVHLGPCLRHRLRGRRN